MDKLSIELIEDIEEATYFIPRRVSNFNSYLQLIDEEFLRAMDGCQVSIDKQIADARRVEVNTRFKKLNDNINLGNKTGKLLGDTELAIIKAQKSNIASGKTAELLKKIGNLTIFNPKDVPRNSVGVHSKATIIVGVENQRQVRILINYFRKINGREWLDSTGNTLTKGDWKIKFIPLTDKQKVLEETLGENVVALFIEHTVLEMQIRRAMNCLLEDSRDSATFKTVKENIVNIRTRIKSWIG